MSLTYLKAQFPHETLPTHYVVWHWQARDGGQERNVIGTADNLKDVHELARRPYRERGYLGPVHGSMMYPDGSNFSIDLRFGPDSIVQKPDYQYRGNLVNAMSNGFYRPDPDRLLYHSLGQTGHEAGAGLVSGHAEVIFTLAHARELLGGVSGMQPFVDAALIHHDLTPLHLAADHLQENASEGDGRAGVEKKLRMLLGHTPEKFARAFATAVATVTK